MWRHTQLARKAFLRRPKGSSKYHELHFRPHQVLLLSSSHKALPLAPSHSLASSSHLTTCVGKESIFFHNLRFFSSDPSTETTEEPVLDYNIGSRLDFDENPSGTKSESDENVSVFDENPGNFGTTDGENEAVLGENEEKVEIDVEKLENVLSLVQSSGVDGSLEKSLEEMGLVLSEEFVVRVLETPYIPGENLIGFYRWCLKKPEFFLTKHLLDGLVSAVCCEMKMRNVYALWDLLKEVGEKESGVLSTDILNELISLFSRMAKGKVAFEVFSKFEEFGCVADADTYYYTIKALCRRSIFDLACSVSERMLSGGILPDAEKVGQIISYLCKGKKSRDAHSVYLVAKEKSRYPSRSSVSSLINSLCFLPEKDKASTKEEVDKIYHENMYLALSMLEDFSVEDRKSAIKPFSSVIQALCKIGDVERAKELLLKMIDAGPPPGNAIFNSIINGLSKAGDLEEATKMLKVMENRGLKPDVYTYSVIMSGYVKGGAVEKARKLLDEAKKKHSKLSPVTYHTLIRGYCKLEQFDEAVKLLAEMKDHGVQPNADEYNKLIQSLCLKALDWGMAEKLLEEMKEKGLHLNGLTRGLVKAVKELENEEGTGEVAAAV